MPAPLETEEHLRIWLLYRPGPGYDFKVEPVQGRGFRGTIRSHGHHSVPYTTAVCDTLSECVKQLWQLSHPEMQSPQKTG